MSVVLPAPKNPVTIVNGVFAEPSGASEEEAIAVDGGARFGVGVEHSRWMDASTAVKLFVAVLGLVFEPRNAPRARRARAPGDESCLGQMR